MGHPDRPGVMSLIFGQMSQRKIPIDMVVQNIGDQGLANVSFTVPQDELAETLTAAEEAVRQLGSGTVQHGTNLGSYPSWGAACRPIPVSPPRCFAALADAGVNIGMITTSDIKISVLVDRNQAKTGLGAVHSGFDLHRERPARSPSASLSRTTTKNPIVPAKSAPATSSAACANMEDIVVSDVLLDREQALVTLRNLPDVPGVAAVVFAENAEAGVMVDMIVQNVGRSGHSHISFTVPKEHLERSLAATKGAIVQWPEAVLRHEPNIAKMSVLGIGLRTHTGVGEKMFRAFAEADINVRIISTSEVCISTVIESSRGEEALQRLTVQPSGVVLPGIVSCLARWSCSTLSA